MFPPILFSILPVRVSSSDCRRASCIPSETPPRGQSRRNQKVQRIMEDTLQTRCGCSLGQQRASWHGFRKIDDLSEHVRSVFDPPVRSIKVYIQKLRWVIVVGLATLWWSEVTACPKRAFGRRRGQAGLMRRNCSEKYDTSQWRRIGPWTTVGYFCYRMLQHFPMLVSVRTGSRSVPIVMSSLGL